MKTFQYYLDETREIGYVETSNHSIVYASGLPNATINEIVLFENNHTGMILSLNRQRVEILVLSNISVKTGMKVTRTNTKQEMPVGKEFLGLTIDPFGNPLDKLSIIVKPKESRPIQVVPAGIDKRKRIERPFETGISMVDLLVPLGKGQRELVIGDRKTGKTSFLLQTLLNQARNGAICIYAAVGKKKMDIKKTEEFFSKMGIRENIVIVASGSEDPAGIIYLTPYCAMTLAEYYRDIGQDVVIVLDDLLTHAKFYREISLIAKRFPGRNSYPADIFFAHSNLLERAGNFLLEDGSEHSITCLPVVESVQGDIAGFIQTNLMSMTDGHIYFDVDSFAKGQRPAVNPFLSVSRVGRQTQSSLRLTIHREIMSFLTLRQRLDNFSHFGTEASPQVKNTLAVGDRILALFSQNATEVNDINLQIIIFGLLWQGAWEDIEIMQKDIKKIRDAFINNEAAKALIKEIIDNSPNLNALLTILKAKMIEIFHSLNVVIEGKTGITVTQPAAPIQMPPVATQPTQPTQPAQPAQPAQPNGMAKK